MTADSLHITYLKKQIENFVNKYYLNQVIRGLLWFLFFLGISYLTCTSLAYFIDLKGWMRLMMFCMFIIMNAFTFIRLLLIPLFRRLYILPRLNYYDSAKLIGTLFPEISDRLLNTLQLYDTYKRDAIDTDLLAASIAQKTEQLKIFEFSKGIDLTLNRKYFKYVLPVLATFTLIVIFIPSILTQGSYRILKFNEEFLPFKFVLSKGNVTVEEGSDIPVSVNLIGERIPDKVYLVTNQGKFLMNKALKNRFDFTIPKVMSSGTFHFEANGYESMAYRFNVTGKNILGKIRMNLIYPAYLNKKNEILENAGDINVPEGTKVICSGDSRNCKEVRVVLQNKKYSFVGGKFHFQESLVMASDMKFTLVNAFTDKVDSTKLHVGIIKDEFPQISLNERNDSIKEGVKYFNGQISDDYGISSLVFHYTIHRKGKVVRNVTLPVTFNRGSKSAFAFAVDFRREDVKLEDRISYYFTVSDNDGVHGRKTTKSMVGEYSLPNLQELNEERAEDQAQAKKDLEKMIEKTKNFERSVNKLKKELNDSKSKEWNNKQQIEQLKEEQQRLNNELQVIKDKIQQSTQEKNQLSEIDKELLEKQEMIQKLLDEVMDDELKKLLDEIEKLFNENKDLDLKNEMNKLDQSSETRTKQLDRTLEMLKKLQVNERIDDIEKELKEAAKSQEEVVKKMENPSFSKEKLLEEQKKIENRFDSIQQKLNEVKELNKDLLDPLNLDNTKALEESIDKLLNDAKEQLNEGKKTNSKKSQQQAADEMEQLAEQLNQQQAASNQQQAEEDIEMLRGILESLMVLSFDQESLIEKFNKVSMSDPKYKKIGREQIRINKETATVRDSLLALAKRQPKIATFIDKELQDISFSQTSAIEAIDDHRKNEITTNQQLVMTSYNNLALLLNEALQQMQAQSQSMMQGNGSCSKPGSGKPKPGGMSTGDMKEMLKKQLEKMQKGQKSGGSKPGDKDGNNPGMKPGSQGMNMLGLGNKEIAKMAAEQTAIRQRLEQLKNELNKDGKGSGNGLNPLLKELENQERDLINKNFNQNMINRQRDILTRLLESEKAVMERGYEEKRESESGKSQNNGNLIELKEYNKSYAKQIEQLNGVDPAFNQYYKKKAEIYFNLAH